MPVSIASQRDPFRGVAPQSMSKILRVPQARVLQALMPEYPDDPPHEFPLLNRAALGVQAGYTAISGTVTRALDGIQRAGTKMGTPHPGLLARGLVEVVTLDLEGITEINYRITPTGVKVFQAYVAAGGRLPPLKDTVACVNNRYKRSKGNTSKE